MAKQMTKRGYVFTFHQVGVLCLDPFVSQLEASTLKQHDDIACRCCFKLFDVREPDQAHQLAYTRESFGYVFMFHQVGVLCLDPFVSQLRIPCFKQCRHVA